MRGARGAVVIVVGALLLVASASETNSALGLVTHVQSLFGIRPTHSSAVPASLASPVSSDPTPVIGDISVEGSVGPLDGEAVNWAQDRFEEAALPLPDIRVTFHLDAEPCEGSQGGYTIENDEHRVLICVSETGRARDLKVKRTLLHEFAHAWDHHALSDEVRSAFTDARGSGGWLAGVPYQERAGEHAAEVITWGLMDRPMLIGSLDDPGSREMLHDEYVALTGLEPPHGYVWSWFAAAHDVHAHTPAQLEKVRVAWERSDAVGRTDRRVQIRFHRDTSRCDGRHMRVEPGDDRLLVQVCSASGDLSEELFQVLTGRR